MLRVDERLINFSSLIWASGVSETREVQWLCISTDTEEHIDAPAKEKWVGSQLYLLLSIPINHPG